MRGTIVKFQAAVQREFVFNAKFYINSARLLARNQNRRNFQVGIPVDTRQLFLDFRQIENLSRTKRGHILEQILQGKIPVSGNPDLINLALDHFQTDTPILHGLLRDIDHDRWIPFLVVIFFQNRACLFHILSDFITPGKLF